MSQISSNKPLPGSGKKKTDHCNLFEAVSPCWHCYRLYTTDSASHNFAVFPKPNNNINPFLQVIRVLNFHGKSAKESRLSVHKSVRPTQKSRSIQTTRRKDVRDVVRCIGCSVPLRRGPAQALCVSGGWCSVFGCSSWHHSFVIFQKEPVKLLISLAGGVAVAIN